MLASSNFEPTRIMLSRRTWMGRGAALIAAACWIPDTDAAASRDARGTWSLLIDGDDRERTLKVVEVGDPANGRGSFRGVFTADGAPPKHVAGELNDSGGRLSLRFFVPSGAEVNVAQLLEDRFAGTFRSTSGRERALQMIRVDDDAAARAVERADLLTVTGASRIQLVYLGAGDCMFCRRWEGPLGYEGSFRRGPAARVVELLKIERTTFLAPQAMADLPAEIRALDKPNDRRVASLMSAAPAWLVILDGRLVLARRGLSNWKKEVEPFVEKLAAAKETSSVVR
jgi:hypothetical protein